LKKIIIKLFENFKDFDGFDIYFENDAVDKINVEKYDEYINYKYINIIFLLNKLKFVLKLQPC